MVQRGRGRPDLTVLAVPFYFGSMVAERAWLRRRAARAGSTAGDYERRDTVASVAMGVGSLVAPLVVPRLLRPFTPGRGRYGKALICTALGSAAVTALADRAARPPARPLPPAGPVGPAGRVGLTSDPLPVLDPAPGFARRVGAASGVVAVVAGGVATTTAWSSLTAPSRFWRHRVLPDWGAGALPVALAVVGWDFIYYWNHRFMHESRGLWAVHVVHHSSQHYNLSTALRQPVADALGPSLPYGFLCLFGIGPELVVTARALNLIYQFWIHTEAIDRIGPPEAVLNTASHHRVHHGSNHRYLDRNHGSILIVWDRLFGTFEPEGERAVYGLTKNINTFNVGRIATHEYRDILRDVAASTSWGERLSYVVRGPGWPARHRAELAARASP
jgi:sterol desaturase/sphingolipid hydroxylase (fatty acid hydroxylase superfamily)